MRELIRFYAPDWDLVGLWFAVAPLPCLFVFWMGALFGRMGALTMLAVVAAVAVGLWKLGGHWGIFYVLAFSLPMTLGALLGLGAWYLWLGRAQKRS